MLFLSQERRSGSPFPISVFSWERHTSQPFPKSGKGHHSTFPIASPGSVFQCLFWRTLLVSIIAFGAKNSLYSDHVCVIAASCCSVVSFHFIVGVVVSAVVDVLSSLLSLLSSQGSPPTMVIPFNASSTSSPCLRKHQPHGREVTFSPFSLAPSRSHTRNQSRSQSNIQSFLSSHAPSPSHSSSSIEDPELITALVPRAIKFRTPRPPGVQIPAGRSAVAPSACWDPGPKAKPKHSFHTSVHSMDDDSSASTWDSVDKILHVSVFSPGGFLVWGKWAATSRWMNCMPPYFKK